MENPVKAVPPEQPPLKTAYFEYAIIACLFLWFCLFILPLPVIQCSDGYFLWVPRLSYAAREILHGRLPLWNPFQFCGTPLLADANTNVLNPGTVFYLFLSPAWAYTLDTLSLFLLLLIGVWKYLRLSGFSLIASLVGAIGYAFSGQVLFWSVYHGMNLVFCLLPWILFSFRKLEKTNQARWGLLSFILTFIMLLGGFVQFALIAAVTVVMEGLDSFSLKGITGSLKNRIAITAAAVLSAGFILLPVIEAAVFSHRRLVAYLPGLFPRKISLLFNALFGYSAQRQGLPFYFYYIGLFVPALAIFGARRHFQRVFRHPLFVYACIFPLIAAAVYLNILPQNFQFGVSSDPFRGMFVFLLALSILSAIGTEEFIAAVKSGKRAMPFPAELIAAFFATLLLLAVFFRQQMHRHVIYAPLAGLGLVFLAGFVAASIFRRQAPRFRGIVFSIWLAALAVLNCVFASGYYLSSSFFHKWVNVTSEFRKLNAPAPAFFPQGRVIYIGPPDDNTYYNFNDCAVYYNIRAIGGYGSFFPKSIFLRMREDGLFTAPYHAATHFRNNNVLDTGVLARYGVAYLAAESRFDKDFAADGWKFQYAIAGPSSHNIYSNPKFIGRAYVADENGEIKRPAEIAKEAGSCVTIFLEGEAGETVILSDSWFPGWECYDNGKRARGFDSRGFRGYRLGYSGFHALEWRYQPKSFLYGGIISFLGFAFFIGWLLNFKRPG